MKFAWPFLLFTLAAPLCAYGADAPLPPEIENEQALGINKLPYHAALMPYATLPEALAAKRHNSSFARSLNGTWKFHYVPRPEGRPVDFYKPDFDVSKWANLTVPSNWQLHGYGTPYYRNNGYTFQRDWPRVMSEPPRNFTAYTERNPVGSYRRNFTVPANWNGRRIFLTFDGVDSAFYLWINGQKVGYSTNSRNAAEFDITPYLKKGASNTLAVEVYRYCAGSYLEDQDMWRLSGIFRNVTLWSAPQLHVQDFAITTDLDSQYKNAALKVTAKIHNYASQPTAARTFVVRLYDRGGKPVPGVRVQVTVPTLQPGQETEIKLEVPVSNPAKWTAETPNLYTAVLSLQNGARTEELLSNRVGFREVEIKGRLFTLNGVPIKLKGANRHENWPDTGHYVTEERMIRDIKLLKQANCNHVRTSHYTCDPRWYELCDEYGLYLVGEANVETHGYYNTLAREPRYEKAFVDRNIANAENIKNSPSVVIYSLGNECGDGSNLRAALKAVKAIDTTRPTHYEAFGVGANNPADIDSQMYNSVEGLEWNAGKSKERTKPFYLCEYAHAMFNSMGSLGEYNDVIDKYPAAMGGAIWEWQDQGILNKRDPKRQYIAYGGGFGEVPNDHYFIHKGVVFSDRSPKPHFPEVKRVYQWIGFDASSIQQRQIKLKNKYAFTNLSRFTGTWNITEDGTVIQRGALPKLDLAPGKEKLITLNWKAIRPVPGAQYFLNLQFTLPTDMPWAKTGYDIANAQFALPTSNPAKSVDAAKLPPLKVTHSADSVLIQGQAFSASFSKTTGQLTGLTRNGINILRPDGGPKLNLWRAPHQIDDRYAASTWNAVGLKDMKAKLLSFSTQKLLSSVNVTASIAYTGQNGFAVTHMASYTIYGDGSITADNAVIPQGPRIILARAGVRLLLDKRLGSLEYLARGPMENYSDRKRGSDIGLYTSTVAAQRTPYSKPMENGNHEDTSWLSLQGGNLPTLLAKADNTPLQFSAQPYTDEEMDPVAYTVDLPASKATVLTLSAKTLGVGSNSCGPRPLPPFMLYSEPVTFSYHLRLLAPQMKNVAALAREALPAARALPVMAERNAEGNIQLFAANTNNAISYSLDGTKWQTYQQPFSLPNRTLLHLRSTTPNGESVTTAITFNPFVDRSKWEVKTSSFERGEGNEKHLIDSDADTFWHSQYSPNAVQPPHSVELNFKQSYTVSSVTVTPRQDGNGNGRVRDYELYLSMDGQNWGQPVSKGRLQNDSTEQIIRLSKSQSAQFLKLVVLNDHSRGGFASIAELGIIPAE